MQQNFGLLFVGLIAIVGLFGNVNSAAIASDSSSTQSTIVDFGTAAMMFTNTIKQAMRTGCPSMNLPVLDPFVLQYFSYNFSNQDASLSGNFTNMVVNGLSNFRFIGASYDNQTYRTTFDIIMPELQVLAEYMVDAWALIAGFPASSSGSGLINSKLEDLRCVGSVTLGTSPSNPKGLYVSEFDIKIYLGDAHINNWNNLWNIALNNFANKWMQEFMLMYVEQIEVQIDDIYAKYVIPNMNDVLENMSMDQLVQAIVTMNTDYSSSNCALPAGN